MPSFLPSRTRARLDALAHLVLPLAAAPPVSRTAGQQGAMTVSDGAGGSVGVGDGGKRQGSVRKAGDLGRRPMTVDTRAERSPQETGAEGQVRKERGEKM